MLVFTVYEKINMPVCTLCVNAKDSNAIMDFVRLGLLFTWGVCYEA